MDFLNEENSGICHCTFQPLYSLIADNTIDDDLVKIRAFLKKAHLEYISHLDWTLKGEPIKDRMIYYVYNTEYESIFICAADADTAYGDRRSSEEQDKESNLFLVQFNKEFGIYAKPPNGGKRDDKLLQLLLENETSFFGRSDKMYPWLKKDDEELEKERKWQVKKVNLSRNKIATQYLLLSMNGRYMLGITCERRKDLDGIQKLQ